MIEEWVATGRICDLALAVLAVETVLLLWPRSARGRGADPAHTLCNAGAGAGLILAQKASMAGPGAGAVLAGLSLALVAHVGETLLRWRRAP